jgi:hypothetical protein
MEHLMILKSGMICSKSEVLMTIKRTSNDVGTKPETSIQAYSRVNIPVRENNNHILI